MRVILLPILLALGACASAPERAPVAPVADKPEALQGDLRLAATLYQQTAAEYQATFLSVYRGAAAQLDQAIQSPGWTAAEEQGSVGFESLPPAIVVDVDETVLDNAPYQARQIKAGKNFSQESFEAWSNDNAAPPLPGALAFLKTANARGVKIFYVTNRSDNERDVTALNLGRYGFPDAVAANVLTRSTTSDKGIRRAELAKRYRLIMLFGDNLGDFSDCYKKRIEAGRDRCTGLPAATPEIERRRAYVNSRMAWWGERWFMLPNPSYGSWVDAITEFDRTLSPEAMQRAAEARLDTVGDPPPQ